MTYWVHSTVTVTGSVDEIARFKQRCNAGELAGLGFPRDTDDLRVYCDEPGRYDFDFDTAWCPPVLDRLGEMFPALDFSVESRDPDLDFALRGTIKNGGFFDYELMEKPGIWKARDPKTGKDLRGTLDEIIDAAGEDQDPEIVVLGAAPVWDDPRVRCCGRRPRGTNDGEFTVT